MLGSDIEGVANLVRGAAAEGQRVNRELMAQQTAVERLLARMPTVSARSAHTVREALYEAKSALREAVTATDQYAITAARFADRLAQGGLSGGGLSGSG